MIFKDHGLKQFKYSLGDLPLSKIIYENLFVW